MKASGTGRFAQPWHGPGPLRSVLFEIMPAIVWQESWAGVTQARSSIILALSTATCIAIGVREIVCTSLHLFLAAKPSSHDCSAEQLEKALIRFWLWLRQNFGTEEETEEQPRNTGEGG